MIEVANEIPVLSTILYYEINCLLLILGFTLFTTLINVILVVGFILLLYFILVQQYFYQLLPIFYTANQKFLLREMLNCSSKANHIYQPTIE